ncbi:MAG TPA: hypothetical protein VMC85_04090 [Desulfomonilaceae bacterium]|nr:hypothetical protein [Desulfomonilaceae bacterium]
MRLKTNLRRTLALVIFLCLLVPGLPALAQFQAFCAPGPEALGCDLPKCPILDCGWYASVKISRMFNSFTSYQFGDPDPSLPNPDSRLEFPLDQWWYGINAGWRLPLASMTAEYLTNLRQNARPKFQDSDWFQQGERFYLILPLFPFLFWVEDWGPADQKNIFSESDCLLQDGSYLFDISMDLNLADLVRPYGNFKVGPVVGYRNQQFLFTTHDGLQKIFPETQELVMIDVADPGGPGIRTGVFFTFLPTELPGDGIKFSQKFQHYYIGGKCRRSFALQPAPARWYLPRLVELEAQADWAWVKGQNNDQHLLRAGRFTMEDTSGGAWHMRFTVNCVMPQALRLGLVGDFTRINTTGNHLLLASEEGSGTALSWTRGVTVWSDQMTLASSLELFF